MRGRSLRLSNVVWLLVLALLVSAIPALAANRYATVELKYDPDTNTCSATPDPVQIFWFKKPKKVKWVSDDANLYWDILWKGGGKNYFGGNFDVKCGQTERKSNLPSGRDKDNAQWSYSIVVYPCEGGQKQGEKLCEVDPVVDWDP